MRKNILTYCERKNCFISHCLSSYAPLSDFIKKRQSPYVLPFSVEHTPISFIFNLLPNYNYLHDQHPTTHTPSVTPSTP